MTLDKETIFEHIQSVRWDEREQHLKLLDQSRLPEEMVFLELETIEEVWEAIRRLQVRGAPAIGMAAAYGLYLGVRSLAGCGSSGSEPHSGVDADELLRQVDKQADYLASSRPTAVNLFWALERMKKRARQELEHVHGEDGGHTRDIIAALLKEGNQRDTGCDQQSLGFLLFRIASE